MEDYAGLKQSTDAHVVRAPLVCNGGCTDRHRNERKGNLLALIELLCVPIRAATLYKRALQKQSFVIYTDLFSVYQ